MFFMSIIISFVYVCRNGKCGRSGILWHTCIPCHMLSHPSCAYKPCNSLVSLSYIGIKHKNEMENWKLRNHRKLLNTHDPNTNRTIWHIILMHFNLILKLKLNACFSKMCMTWAVQACIRICTRFCINFHSAFVFCLFFAYFTALQFYWLTIYVNMFLSRCGSSFRWNRL